MQEPLHKNTVHQNSNGVDSEKITYFAMTDSRGKRKKFGIKRKDRSKHMYIIGKTGMGKSTLLENMAIQDIQNGEGLAFIDPHGASAEKLLDYIPEDRIKDVLYFAPFDTEHPVAFNVMEDVGYDKRHLVVSGLMSAFKKIWVDAWSGRMEYILSNTLLALLEYPDATLLDVNRMYTNKVFRKKVVENISDPLIKVFWVEEFAMYTDRYTQEATPAIQNKIGQFTSNPLIRNIIGQPKSTFDLRDIMDDKKIFIANLSKGRIGETNADLIGSMLTTKIYLSAMSRADLPATELQKLPDFYFYVDEFQSIANESFANILSEARKYKLNLTIAHQYIEQMEENVRNAVFGNVGTTISFRVGPFDAEVLETIFKPQFTEEDLVNLGFAQIYLTLMIDGVGSKPFSAETMPPIEIPRLSYREQVISWSRQNYGRSRSDIEAEMKKRSRDNSALEKIEKKDVARSSQKNVRENHGGEQVSENRQKSQLHPPKFPKETLDGKQSRPQRERIEHPTLKDTEQKEKHRSALRDALATVIKTEEEAKKSSPLSPTPTDNEKTDKKEEMTSPPPEKKEVPEEKLRKMLGGDDK